MLVRRIEAALSAGSDIGNLKSLESYSKVRYRKNLAIMTSVDMIDKILNTGSTSTATNNDTDHRENELPTGLPLPVVTTALINMRALGMLGINGSGILKTQVARLAMGYDI